MASLKLGNYSKAHDTISKLTAMPDWTSKVYLREQATFLLAICNKILGNRWD
jgi:hypothetical protein